MVFPSFKNVAFVLFPMLKEAGFEDFFLFVNTDINVDSKSVGQSFLPLTPHR